MRIGSGLSLIHRDAQEGCNMLCKVHVTQELDSLIRQVDKEKNGGTSDEHNFPVKGWIQA